MKNIFASLVFFPLVTLLIACTQQAAENPYPLSPNDVRPLLTGTEAPGFTIRDSAGKPFDFDPGKLEAPVMLIFYRGGWCPFCNKHLMKLRNIEDEMLALGFDTLFISADSFENIQSTLSEQEFSYTLLSDNDLKASTAFGLTYYVSDELLAKLIEKGHDIKQASGREHRLLPVPAVFMINVDGIIAYQYVNPNYKVRMEPSVILAAAKTMLPSIEN